MLRCVANCECEERWVDGHHSLKESQLFLAELNATQAEECVIEVEVDSKSSSGEHKFKVGRLHADSMQMAGPAGSACCPDRQ